MKESSTVERDTVVLQQHLERVQVFLAAVLTERTGPLSSVQRDLIQSAATSARRAEQLLDTDTNPH